MKTQRSIQQTQVMAVGGPRCGVREDQWRTPLLLPWVDQEGEALEALVSKKRDRTAGLKFPRKLMKRYLRPDAIVTDRLRSDRAALREVGGSGLHQAAAG